MTNSFVFPFNFNPSATNYGSPARSYTVPAGKYAIVRITMACSSYAVFSDNISSNTTDSSNSNNAVVKEVILSAAEVLTVTETAGSQTTTTLTGAATGIVSATASQSCTAAVDGNEIARLQSGGFARGQHVNGAGTSTITVVGLAQSTFTVAEYTAIT